MKNERTMETGNSPQCIGIIMDGNRRWAKKRGTPVFLGHTEGYKKFKEFIGWAKEYNIKHIIAYAFSTENWKRPKEEVDHLMGLLRNVLDNEIASLKKKGIKLRFIGEIEKFPKDIIEKLKTIESETASLGEIEVIIALSYGGRAEIVSAIKKLTAGDIENLTENSFSEFLFTKGIPDPDLIIRTGGEMRLSNFLLWQSAYSELFFSETYWPDFTREEFDTIVDKFSSRERRNGK